MDGLEFSDLALRPALKLLPMDKSLRTTVPGVLTKTPDQRGVFDGTARGPQSGRAFWGKDLPGAKGEWDDGTRY